MAMYYNPPPNQPTAMHDGGPNPWSRTHHAVLSTGGTSASGAPLPSPSPGYGIAYANGTNALHHHPSMSQHQPLQHHQHHNSLSQSMAQYPSPPIAPPGMRTSPPTNGNGTQMVAPHWHAQLMKAEMCRQASSPHHRARASAMATRNSAKAAIPITDPNRPTRQLHVENGVIHDGSTSDSTDSETGAGTNLATATEDHPSSTVAPVAQAPRLTVVQPKLNNGWTVLDMGGIRLKNVSTALFKYTYLTTLYLNHNSITVVPPAISSLRNLLLLDLSGNQLVSLPPEMGMLTSLRELFLFDNHISTLPFELGSLHELDVLGIEGNPLDSSLKAIVQKDGTRALIAYLRDRCDVPAPPPERAWRILQSDAERKQQDADPSIETLTLLNYNILCERAATSQLYGYTPSWALAWDYRKELILTEIMNYDTDFLCLQEVDVAQYEEYFSPHLQEQDYAGIYSPKARAKTMTGDERKLVDGCAIFYKSNKFQLVESHLLEFPRLALQRPDFQKTDDMFNRILTKDYIALVGLFENRATGSRLIVANAHLYWDKDYPDVKLVQTGLLMEEVDKFAAQFAKYPPRLLSEHDVAAGQRPPLYTDGTKIPTIVCGDYNSGPESAVYSFLSTGAVAPDHPDFKNHTYGDYTTNGIKHRFGLKDAYAGINELTMTNFTPGFQGVIDYIWYSGHTLTVSSLLGEVEGSYLAKSVGFPNAHFPSDHICLITEFRVKPPKETAGRQPAPNGVARNS